MQISHYSKEYFNWQKKDGSLAGKVQKFLFEDYINKETNLLEFGSGGGFLLESLVAKNKKGIEINADARKFSIENGLDIVEKIDEIPDKWADVIISNHVLEHTFNPLGELESLYCKLKNGGNIIFVIPNEKKIKYKPNDINQHLFTWSEMNIGNLFVKSGYEVVEVKEIYHRYPPLSNFLLNTFGLSIFRLTARIYGFMANDLSQIRVIATKR